MHTYIPTYLHTYIPTYLHTYIPTYLHTDIPTYRHTGIPTYRLTDIPTYRHTYIPTNRHTYIATYLHTYIPTWLHTYIPTFQTCPFWGSETGLKLVWNPLEAPSQLSTVTRGKGRANHIGDFPTKTSVCTGFSHLYTSASLIRLMFLVEIFL